MATFTPNYGLHQWVPEDKFTRADFNQDFAALDTALGRTERGMEANRTNLYNLLLQRDYEGKYSGWKRGLIFDGFQDDSKIESITDNMVRSTAGKFLFINGETSESEDVNFGSYAGVTLQPGESLSETWTCDRMGWAAALRLYMSGQGTLVITNGSGTFTKTEVKGSTGSTAEEVAFPWGLTLDPGETYTFRYTATTQSVLYHIGSCQFGYRVMLTNVPEVETGILVTKPLTLDKSFTEAKVAIRRSIYTPNPSLFWRESSSEVWSPLPKIGSRETWSVNGTKAAEIIYGLSAAAEVSTFQLKMEITTHPTLSATIFDYAVVIL